MRPMPMPMPMEFVTDPDDQGSAMEVDDVDTPAQSQAAVTANPPSPPTVNLNKYSSTAMLYGVGLSEDDMLKPQVGISSVWYEGNLCNMHLLKLSNEVKRGVEDAGMVGFRFNTVGVSDAISMGTRGMSFSWQSRDLIADSIETIMGVQWYDGNISIPGCDKNMPGTLIAMGRLNRPSLMVYGGAIKVFFFALSSASVINGLLSFLCKWLI
ncbi:hypothetical protein V6Z12_D02G147700, partial [Gossypium hirsutum]